MKTALFATAAAACLAACSVARAEEPVKSYAIPSWGDYTVVYGPGTTPSMGSPAEMEKMFRFWKGRGYNGVFLRSDLQQVEPFVSRNPKNQMNAPLALLWQYVDKQSERFDYFRAAQQTAEKIGFEFWVWHPHFYSQGAPTEAGVEGWGRMIPWGYQSKLFKDHPETVSVDRKGNKYWMVPEYGYPEARKHAVDEVLYMAKTYGVKNFIISMRSEVNQLIDPADKADRFGFNKVVVDDMKRLYDVDIMTDPRFDVDSPTFDLHDAMVENWRTLRGSYVTETFRELRAAADKYDPGIKIAVTVGGDRMGPPLGNWKMDWRAMVDEGLVDMIIAPVFFEATLDSDAGKKGYLTNVREGVGVLPLSTLRDYIKASKHPEIQILSTGGPPYFNKQPQAGADGWQRDVWYSSYHLAWYERWNQYLRDVKDFGAISFLKQDFDTVSPKDFAGISGGWGLHAYDPKLRACPGDWWRLGDGTNNRPFAQTAVRRGAKGQALQLTSAADGSGSLSGWHISSPDRSKYTGAVDTSITNGIAAFDFWIRLQSAESGLSAFLQGDGSELDIGLNVAPKTGIISYSTGREGGAAKWTPTAQTLAPGEWRKFTIRVDLDNKTYSASTGDAQKSALCEGVPIEIPKDRIIQQHGVNVDIRVPAYREFQRVSISPLGVDGSVTWLDDLEVRWKPTLHFTPQGAKVELADNFESYAANTNFGKNGAGTSRGLQAVSTLTGSFVTNEMSWGDGVKGLYVTAGETVAPSPAKRLNVNQPVTVDFDVFISADESYPYLIPNFTTKSTHRADIGLIRADGSPLASVRAGDGAWQLWNGDAWQDSGVKINYDCWNHLQLALDGKGGYQVAAQPEGQVPALVGKARTGGERAGDTVTVRIDTSGGRYSVYDNLVVTSGSPAAR